MLTTKLVKIKCNYCSNFFIDYLSNKRKHCNRKCYNKAQREIPTEETSGYTHGMTHTPFHTKWLSMIQRCNDKKHHKYPIYGGRGIKMCKSWALFDNFYNDMYHSYKKHLEKNGSKDTTIDRIDVNGGYSKQNCRWATRKEQSNNKTNTIWITYKGKTLNLKQWSKDLNIEYSKLYRRFRTQKKTFEEAINI